MKRFSLLSAVCLLLMVAACKKQSSEEEPDRNTQIAAVGDPVLLFKTNFTAPSSAIVNHATLAPSVGQDISGNNENLGFPWDNSTAGSFGNAFKIYYEEGTSTDRQAYITTDDPPSSESILKFRIVNPNVPAKDKARIQTDIYSYKNAGQNLKEFYQSVRVKLHYSSFNEILEDHNRLVYTEGGYDSRDWLTLFELWNNKDWDGALFPFRIGLGLAKKKPYPTDPDVKDQFIFKIDAQKKKNNDPANWDPVMVWKEEPPMIVPVGSWMTIEIYFKEGNNSTGKFWVAVQPDGQPKTVICNKTGWTYSPLSNITPDGITELNPMKLYTSENIINRVKSGGQALQVSFDSYRLYDKMPY